MQRADPSSYTAVNLRMWCILLANTCLESNKKKKVKSNMKTLKTSRCKQIRQFKAEINSQPWVCSSTERNSAEHKQKQTFNFRLWLFSAFFFLQSLQGYSNVSRGKAEVRVLLLHLHSLKSNMTCWHLPCFPITKNKTKQTTTKAEKWNALWKFPQKFPEAQNSSWACQMLWK